MAGRSAAMSLWNDSTPALDTLKMARRILPQLSTYKLANIAQYFGVAIDGAHRALADAEMTVTVFHRLLDIASRQGFQSPKDLFKEFSVSKPNFKIEEANQDVLF